MAITKTNFINYSRCRRYVALDEIKSNKLNADISYEEYKEEEINEEIKNILIEMYDEEGEDLIDVEDPQLNVMMKYFNEIEILAANKVKNMFGDKVVFAYDNFAQQSFEFRSEFFKYICYVDIFSEDENIIEVKATTKKKYLELNVTLLDKSKESLFELKNGIYKIKEFNKNMQEKTYMKQFEKLTNRYHSVGKYVYDLAVQRYFIEKSGRKNFKYYLAVLNDEYIFDGTYEDGKPIYSDDIIGIFDFTDLTEKMMESIEYDMLTIEKNLSIMDASNCKVGTYCEFNKTTECKFKKICFSNLPNKNSSFNYLNLRSFDTGSSKYNKMDLYNEGYYNMLDVPYEWLKNPNHFIQREALSTNKPYINKMKMKLALNNISYPIYHLDFETFPCPFPRFKGEKCYEQSPFQFSLHIEYEKGKCDENKDHYEYLSSDFNNDCREEIVKKLVEYIDTSKGTILGQNVSFEQSVIKRLANNYPEYKEQLLKMVDMAYDLLYIIKGNNKFYEELGFEDKTVNYYHSDLSGSYSLKKTLSVFSDLSYSNLEVKNGTEALTTYALFPTMSKNEFGIKYKALLEYCKLDTYSMVVILQKIRILVV